MSTSTKTLIIYIPQLHVFVYIVIDAETASEMCDVSRQRPWQRHDDNDLFRFLQSVSRCGKLQNIIKDAFCLIQAYSSQEWACFRQTGGGPIYRLYRHGQIDTER